MYISLEGIWKAELRDGTTGDMVLPGTLDENKLGHRDCGANQWHPDQHLGNAGEDFRENAPISTRFTRKYTYEGEVKLTRQFDLSLPEGKRVFLEAERARVLRLFIDGTEIFPQNQISISTPYIFEVTGMMDGEHEVTLLSDNSYPGLPREDILYSSAATDETQTNWNGVLGYLRLRVEEKVFLQSLAVYPIGGKLSVKAEISAIIPWKGYLAVESKALEQPVVVGIEMGTGISQTQWGKREVVLKELRLAEDVKLWDEEEGNLYELQAVLYGWPEAAADNGQGQWATAIETDRGQGQWATAIETDSGQGQLTSAMVMDKRTVAFGIRTFGDDGAGRLALNGRTIFLRSETNCGVFPETGHAPMTAEEWEGILGRYRSYGVNCVRFHSHCPPKAAFMAADRIGMLMQPELPHWNPRDAFGTEESYRYYRAELEAIIRMLANHPSFVMLTLGNELQAGDVGHRRMDELLGLARSLDATRLYANGSNVHYGEWGCDPQSDFYTSQSCRQAVIRGTSSGMQGYINQQYPNAKTNYDKDMALIRQEYKKPVFSFEVGQYEVLPDFREIGMFQGISEPVNLQLIRDKVKARGLEGQWERYVEASGELALIGYREEIEAAMRTKGLSGISLLGLQDFPGQGTALVGMMNSHLQPKPYDFARPERFRAFFRESLPLAELGKYTYESGETLKADVLVANFGKQDIEGELTFVLKPRKRNGGGTGDNLGRNGSLGHIFCPKGTHTKAGCLGIGLDFVKEPTHFLLTVQIGNIENTYPIWVYPAVKPVCPEGVYETEVFDDKAKAVLGQGGSVYLTPKSDKGQLPFSIQGQFTTDFWSVGTFPGQEGGMGQLIDAAHPVFDGFPTETHTDWQWWAMASRRAVILPKPMECIITEMDSYAYLRPMAQLVEFKCGKGKVLLSSMGLQDLQQYPEARALLASVYNYLGSGGFGPQQELAPEEVAELVYTWEREK